MSINLNITEIPTDFIGQQLDLSVVEIKSNELIIKSGAFQQLKNLQFLYLQNAKINQIENGAFKSNYTKLTNPLHIIFRNCNLTNGSFQNGSFDGIERTPIEIAFYHMNINSLDEGVFKSVLNHANNTIDLRFIFDYSRIDCEDCKNYWLIKEKKDNQVLNARCKSHYNKSLFDEAIKK